MLSRMPLVRALAASACDTKDARLTSTALDAIHKLLAYKWIQGSFYDEEEPERKLIDKVILIVCGCFETREERVQLQMIKAFATAVTSPVCSVMVWSTLAAKNGS